MTIEMHQNAKIAAVWLTQQTSSLLCYNRRRAAQLAGRGL